MAKDKEKIEVTITPVLTPTPQVIIPVEETGNGGLIIARKDAKGNEIPDSEFSASTRMWDKHYSKDTTKNFFIKKK